MRPVNRESTTALITESFIANKTSPQLLEKLAAANLHIAEAQDTLLQNIYTENRPKLKKELTTGIASILLFGKSTLSTDLTKIAESAQKKLVTNEEVKDNKLIEAVRRGPKGPGQQGR